jgi:uncharacterized protein YndB with AHSA1/START domain
MDPVTAHVVIDRPREEVFDYLADIANHAEFSDHYGWGDMTFIEVERPYRIVAAGRGGKFNRNKTWTTWTLTPQGHATRVEVSTETEPAFPTDRIFEALTRRRGWTKRRVGKALRRLQGILEEGLDRGERVTVGGL